MKLNFIYNIFSILMDDVQPLFFQLHISGGVSLSKQIIILDASCSFLREKILFPYAYLYRKKGFLIQRCMSRGMKTIIGNRKDIRIVEDSLFIKYSCWLTLSWCNMTIFSLNWFNMLHVFWTLSKRSKTG